MGLSEKDRPIAYSQANNQVIGLLCQRADQLKVQFIRRRSNICNAPNPSQQRQFGTQLSVNIIVISSNQSINWIFKWHV